MSAASVLAWRLIEAPTSWHWSLGKAGEYKIFYENGWQSLHLPDGSRVAFKTIEAAMDEAEDYEELFLASHKPAIPKFWMIYGIHQGSPRYMHKTKESALQEASRRSKLSPGIAFVVLEAVDAFEADAPKVQQIEIGAPQKVELSDDDIPF